MLRWTLLLFVLISISACDSILELSPENALARDEFWKTKEDVEAAMVGCYDNLQGCLEPMVVWGEVRSDLISLNQSHASGNLQLLASQIIDQENSYCNWGQFYSVINRVNTVEKFAPKAFEADASFTEEMLNNYIAECYYLRSLSYFYLVRTFKSVPLVLEASESDRQDYLVEKESEENILKQIISDLAFAETHIVTNYNNYTDAQVRNKGRVTKAAVNALQADVFLWMNNYSEANTAIDKVLANSDYDLVAGEEWFSLFNPGNSNEGIFEIQYNRNYNERNSLVRWFSPRYNNWFFLNTSGKEESELWSPEGGTPEYVRGQNATYNAVQTTTVWKWAGNDSDWENYRTTEESDANWIVYRLADLFLMKAEALNEMNRPLEALVYLNIIRQRALVDTYFGASKSELQELILDERARELAFEGKRWFDLVRMARRGNPNILINRIVEANATGRYQNVLRARIIDPESWFLPIHKNELDINPNLVQNPYYAN